MPEILSRLAIAAGVAIALSLASPAPVFAQGRDEAAERALVLVERGRLAYKEGRFADAVLLLREAYAIKNEPVLLYNIARAHEGAGDLESAIAEYDRYLATTGVPDRADIEKRVAALRTQVEETRRQSAVVAEEAAARAERERHAKAQADGEQERRPNLIPWFIAGGGAVVVGAGAVVGILALRGSSSAEEAPSQAQAVEDQDAAESMATISTVLFIAGGVLVAGGVTWGVIDLTSSSSSTSALQLQVGPAGASLRGAF